MYTYNHRIFDRYARQVAQGIEQGRKQESLRILLRQLQRRFGSVSEAV